MDAEASREEVERVARDLCRAAGHDCDATVRLQLGADWLPHEIEFMQKSSPMTLLVKDGKVIAPPMLLDIPRWREFRPAAYEQLQGQAPEGMQAPH
ncbi:hypothetical protein [Methylobacterium sp. R2-1]|uniref:hypothetical protein n=1 Tax=Methylobacterium sp. R2-1 TaxID=2587064 RepID=UPI001615D491|nr:hypothetical protein [Methylobacterium sp. R2-1]MBB2963085.1 hypothetical protein [Methylobacterium sp. R2-1]